MTPPCNMSTALVGRSNKKRRAFSDEDGDSDTRENLLPAWKSKNKKRKKKAKIHGEDELMDDALLSAGEYGIAAIEWDYVPRKIKTPMQDREDMGEYQTTTSIRDFVKAQAEETDVDEVSKRMGGSEEGTVVVESENEHFEQEEEDDDLPLASQVSESRVETVEYLGEHYSRSKAHKAKRLVEFLALRKMRLRDYLDEDLRPMAEENAWLGEKKEEEMQWSKGLINRLVDLSKDLPNQEDFNRALREELAKRKGGLRQIRPKEVCRIIDRLRDAKAKEEAERAVEYQESLEEDFE